jgi:hypothetical protein
MSHIVVDVWLYGECACYGDKVNLDGVANLKVKLFTSSTIRDLLDYLLICTHEFDTVLINGELYATPSRQLEPNLPLEDGARFDFLDSQNLHSSKFRTARHWLINNSLRNHPAGNDMAYLLKE